MMMSKIFSRPVTTALFAVMLSSAKSSATQGKLIFRQLFEQQSSTYTYLLADAISTEAILIDPVLETVERDAQLVTDLGLSLKYVINTHCHADHISGTGLLKLKFPKALSAISSKAGAKADIQLNEHDILSFGERSIYSLSTSGHTSGCISYVLDDKTKVFTGDALFIRGCGRTDFQGGSAEELYDNVHSKLFTLPDETEVYPGHDYKGFTSSTIGEEKRLNPRLSKSKEEFVHIMVNLNLPYPKKIDTSLPANINDGIV